MKAFYVSPRIVGGRPMPINRRARLWHGDCTLQHVPVAQRRRGLTLASPYFAPYWRSTSRNTSDTLNVRLLTMVTRMTSPSFLAGHTSALVPLTGSITLSG